jgi:sec-independent protein translocase protein TatA
MTTARRLLALLAAVVVAAVALPAHAQAHGDPASHYLETDQLYPGFANRPSQAVELQLLGMLEAARQDGYPIKVGIVGSPDDLTDDPSMFGRPQAYAESVAAKLGGPHLQAPVLIVGPKGVGLAGVQQRGTGTLRITRADAARFDARITFSQRPTGDELARASMHAVRRLAAAGGHVLPADIPPAKVLSAAAPNRASGGIDVPLPFLLFAGIFLASWLYFETRTQLARRRAGPAPRPSLTPEVHMPTIGPTELIIVLVLALVILGPKRLPAAGRSLGQGMREFKDSITGTDAATDDASAKVERPEPLRAS